VQEGDVLVGWRGDPQMDVYLDQTTGNVLVYAFDRFGERYLAVVEDARFAGWQHRLLMKLRDGDWQTNSAEKLVDKMRDEWFARQKVSEDKAGELAEKMAWAARTDEGTKRFF
jgi:hypothetical protein